MIRSVKNFLKKGFTRLSDRAAEWIVSLLIISILIIIVWVFIGGVPSGFYDDKGKVSLESIGGWGASNAAFLAEGALNFFTAHPLKVVLCFAFLSMVGLAAYFAIRYGKAFLEIFRDFAQTHELTQRVGLFGFSPTAKPDAEIGDWDRLAAEITNPTNRILYVLGATGWDTFGHRKAPLFDPLGVFTGHIRIILMDEASPHLRARAASVGMKEASYKKQIKKSIERIRELHGRGRYIELALYDSPPNWKMIITAQFGWIQHYWRELHVADTPVYLFYATDDQKGLYHAFFDDFDRIWSLARKIPL